MKKIIIEKIIIQNFRNIKELNIKFNENKNEISGSNGTGKSSILDAILYILFLKDYDNKKTKNIRKIDELSQQSNLAPNIELFLKKDNSIVKLNTKNDKWFIDDIEQKNPTTYQESLSAKLNVDLNALFVKICPIMLFETLTSNKVDKKDLRNSIITIVNALNSDDDKIDESKLEEILFNIKDNEEKLTKIKKEIKEIQQSIDNQKKDHPEIKSWKIVDTDKEELLHRKKRLSDKISKYNEIADRIKNSLDLERDLKIEIMNLENSLEIYSPKKVEENYSKQLPKKSFLRRIFNFFFGWISKIFKRNKNHNQNEKNNNQKEDYDTLNVNTEIRLKKEKINFNNKKIDAVQKEIQQLQTSCDYENIDCDMLKNELKKYMDEINDKDIYQEQIIKLLSKETEINNFKNEQINLDNELTILNYDKKNFDKKINNILKRKFENFDINLFGNDEKDTIIIKYKGINWEDLNKSKKMNIIFEINNFLQNKIGLYPFVLIDNVESINKVFDHKNNQLIMARVTNDVELKLNGENIIKSY